MTEDILEQLVEECLKHRGYFTRTNERFKPSKDHPEFVSKSDSVASDVDVIAMSPLRDGVEKVIVVSCKSWQAGFDAAWWRKTLVLTPDREINGREAWKAFRELVKPKWTEGLVQAVSKAANTSPATPFTYAIAMTHFIGDTKAEEAAWRAEPGFDARLRANLTFMPLEEMLAEVLKGLSTTPAATQLGRMLQVVKAAGFEFVRAR